MVNIEINNQSEYLEFAPLANIIRDHDGEDSMSHYHGNTVYIRVPYYQDANPSIVSTALSQPLGQELLSDLMACWQGSEQDDNYNWIGQWSDDLDKVIELIEDYIEECCV